MAKTHTICAECHKGINLTKERYVKCECFNALDIQPIRPQYFHLLCYNQFVFSNEDVKRIGRVSI